MVQGFAYRVRSDVDVLLVAISDQSVGLEERVTFDLVGGGNDTGVLDEGLELLVFSWILDSRDLVIRIQCRSWRHQWSAPSLWEAWSWPSRCRQWRCRCQLQSRPRRQEGRVQGRA